MSERDLYGGAPDDGARTSGRIIHTRVLDNCDRAGLARVTVQIPWLDGPVVATVATGAAGKGRGMYFIPQKGDEVLVLVKEQPDLTAYVIGSVWTSQEHPPRRQTEDPKYVQLIRTPEGHEIVFDDKSGELVITASGGQRVSLSKNGVEIRSAEDENKGAVVKLSANGRIDIEGQSISVTARGELKLEGKTVSVQATGGNCDIKGGPNIFLN
jgi:uncharacterized protein involved in type VI secretion and phage assembly